MIGAIVGAVGSIGSAVAGGIAGRKAYQKQKKNLAAMASDETSWYNRQYNRDVTNMADAQRMWTKTGDALRDRNKQIAATQSVMGGTEESVAAQREQSVQALADAASNITASGVEKKDAIDSAHQTARNNLYNMSNQMEAQRATNLSKVTGQAVQGIANAASGFDSLLKGANAASDAGSEGDDKKGKTNGTKEESVS